MDEEGPKPVVEEDKAALPLPEQKPSRPRVLDKLLRPFLRRGEPPETSDKSDTRGSLRGEQESEASFSLTGSQLRALALTHNFVTEEEHRWHEEGVNPDVSYKKSELMSKRLTQAILISDIKTIKKIVKQNTSENAQLLISSLEEEVPLERVLKKSEYDVEFLQSLSSSSVPRHKDFPTEDGEYIVPDLGTRVFVLPEQDIVQLPVNPYYDNPDWEAWKQKIELPLHEQHFEWVNSDDIYGTHDETFRSQLEVFGALAKTTDTVYTHSTGEQNLPGILTSESFGTTLLRGAEASANNYYGLNVEKAKLGGPDDYTLALNQMDSGMNRVKAPIKNVVGRNSFISSYYINPGDTGPIILFDESVTEHRKTIPNPGGIGIIGETRFDEPSLIGIWVTPTFRKNLLHWISEWPEEKKRQFFKGRPPEDLLISTAEQLPEKYHSGQSKDAEETTEETGE